MFAERAESSRNVETLPPNAFARFLTFIRFSHTVFALPFALGALFVAADGWPASRTLVLVILCMICARTAAMLFNRLVDWSLDQRNPRTKSRHRLIPKTVTWLLLGFSSVAFVIAAAAINRATFLLSPVALAIIFLYSITKRLTDTTHFFLGLALAVGILVDDATVEIENINRQFALGKPIQQAILDGARQIAVPTFVATLCICIVFVPMFFLSGVARFLFEESVGSDIQANLYLESDQPISAWASQIDNATNDPSMLLSARTGATRLLIPSSANIGTFSSSLVLMNVGVTTAQVAMKAYGTSGELLGQSSTPLVIDPNGVVSFENVLQSLGVTDNYGPIEITSLNNVPIIASSRVSSTTRSGGFFQGLKYSEASLVQTIAHVVDNSEIRTNLGINNPTEFPATVAIRLFDKNGRELASTSTLVAPRGLTQMNNVVRTLMNLPDVANVDGYVQLQSDQPIFGWASQIDNLTNDPGFAVSKGYGATRLIVQSTANVGSFKSSLVVVNLGSAPAVVDLISRDSEGVVKGESRGVVIPADLHMFAAYRAEESGMTNSMRFTRAYADLEPLYRSPLFPLRYLKSLIVYYAPLCLAPNWSNYRGLVLDDIQDALADRAPKKRIEIDDFGTIYYSDGQTFADLPRVTREAAAHTRAGELFRAPNDSESLVRAFDAFLDLCAERHIAVVGVRYPLTPEVQQAAVEVRSAK
jgi:hypothetical protein